jgi:predicted DNA-binding protein with PD1-like motif
MRYRVIEQVGERRTFVLVLDAGEEVTQALTTFATELGLQGASLTGIGALSRASLGWFNPQTKEFRQNEVTEQAEVLAITGNIARADDGDAAEAAHDHPHVHGEGPVRLHIHIVLGCGDSSVRGGHLVSGIVSPTMELIVAEAETHLRRGLDAETGLVLLEPRHPCPHRLQAHQTIERVAS